MFRKASGKSLMLVPHDPRHNHLLAALAADEYERLFPHLQLVPMPLGHVLSESGIPMRYVYFPTTAIASRLYELEDGASVEISVVGNEGIIGVSLFMGGETSLRRTFIEGAGHAYRLPGPVLMEEFYRAGQMQHLLLRYVQAMMTQIAQTEVCTRHHSVDQRLCLWLLLKLDRLSTNELTVTQNLIATMLGVRREGVSEAAVRLQRTGLIDYRRGHITVLDRAGLAARVCECYEVLKKEFDRLLPKVTIAIKVSSYSKCVTSNWCNRFSAG